MFKGFNISKKTGISIMLCLTVIWGGAFALIHHFNKKNIHRQAYGHSNFNETRSRKKAINNRPAIANMASKDKLQNDIKSLVSNGTITQDQANKIVEAITSNTKNFNKNLQHENKGNPKLHFGE